jgi:spore germination protein GerM
VTRARALAGALVLAALAAAGCGLPQDEQPRIIAADEAPLSLSQETPAAEDLAPGQERAILYFFTGDGTGLVQVRHPVEASDDPSTELQRAVQSLVDGPSDEDRAATIVSAIPRSTTLLGVQLAGDGVARIDLGSTEEGGGVLSVQGTEQVNLFAQFVYTATQITGVSGVLFSVNGAPQSVLTEEPSGGSVDTPVTRANYPSFDPSAS